MHVKFESIPLSITVLIFSPFSFTKSHKAIILVCMTHIHIEIYQIYRNTLMLLTKYLQYPLKLTVIDYWYRILSINVLMNVFPWNVSRNWGKDKQEQNINFHIIIARGKTNEIFHVTDDFQKYIFVLRKSTNDSQILIWI